MGHIPSKCELSHFMDKLYAFFHRIVLIIFCTCPRATIAFTLNNLRSTHITLFNHYLPPACDRFRPVFFSSLRRKSGNCIDHFQRREDLEAASSVSSEPFAREKNLLFQKNSTVQQKIYLLYLATIPNNHLLYQAIDPRY